MADQPKPTDIPENIWSKASGLWGHEARIGIARSVMAECDRCLQAVAEQRCERGTPWDLALVTAMNAIKPGSAIFEPKPSDTTGHDYDTRQSGDNSWRT